MLLQRLSPRIIRNYLNLLQEIWESNFPQDEVRSLISEKQIYDLLIKYPNLKDVEIFTAAIKKSLEYYKNKYPYFTPTPKHILSDKVIPVALNILEREGSSYAALPRDFLPIFCKATEEVKLRRKDAFRIYYLCLLINTSDNFSYIPASLIAIEKLMLYTCRNKPTFLYPDLDNLKETISSAHKKLLHIRDSKRDNKKPFLKVHFSRCFVKKQLIKIFPHKNLGFSFWECAYLTVSKGYQLKKLGIILSSSLLQELEEKLKSFIIRYKPYLWILPHSELFTECEVLSLFSRLGFHKIRIVNTVLK